MQPSKLCFDTLLPKLTMNNQENKGIEHEPNCGVHIQCAVYHKNGICDHPYYGKCTCGAFDPNKGIMKSIKQETMMEEAITSVENWHKIHT